MHAWMDGCSLFIVQWLKAGVQLLFAEAGLIVYDAANLRFPAWDTTAAAALTTNRNIGCIIVQQCAIDFHTCCITVHQTEVVCDKDMSKGKSESL